MTRNGKDTVMKKRVVVVGGTGYVGSAIAESAELWRSWQSARAVSSTRRSA